jgi:hypothetical protein
MVVAGYRKSLQVVGNEALGEPTQVGLESMMSPSTLVRARKPVGRRRRGRGDLSRGRRVGAEDVLLVGARAAQELEA